MKNENPDTPFPSDGMEALLRRLREDEDVSGVDFQAMESRLMHRIGQAEEMGPLSLLMAERIPTEGFWERVEANLSRRTSRHAEYDTPVNECLADHTSVQASTWNKVEKDLEGRIHQVAALPEWEQVLKSPEIPSPGYWENQENAILDRIQKAEAEGLSGIPVGHPQADRSARTGPILWPLFTLITMPRLRAAALSLLFVAMGFLTWRGLAPDTSTPQIVVYQARGQSMAIAGSALSDRRNFHSEAAGALTLVHERGFIEIENGSGVEIQPVSRSQSHVKAAMAPSPGSKITFFVKHRKQGEKYQVSTPDYRIEVIGTYFQLQSDLWGRISTSVLEGNIRVTSPDFGDLEVSAGQSLVYDSASNAYRVEDGGRTVPRHEIEKLPEVEELREFALLTLESDVPGAEVRLDGRYKGVTPLAILQPAGELAVRISKEGYRTLDTLIRLETRGEAGLRAKLLPNSPTQPLARKTPDVRTKTTVPEPVDSAGPSLRAEKRTIDYYQQAEEAESRDWQLAVRLYLKALDDPSTPRLRKEAALFSVAKLRADNSAAPAQAHGDFLRYLALYPSGAFAGECWLRLAELEFRTNPDKALEYYLKYFEKYPRHHRISELQHRVGLIYLQQGKIDQAVSMLRESLANLSRTSGDEREKIRVSLDKAMESQSRLRAPEDSVR